MRVLDIGEVAGHSGVRPSTLRYYEKIGLICSVGRHGLRRQYDSSVLSKLSLIGLGQLAGFSLAEIAGMFAADGRLNIPRADLHARADVLQRQIMELRMLWKALRHVADCSAPSHLECPTFRKLMTAAARVQVTKRVSHKRAADDPQHHSGQHAERERRHLPPAILDRSR